MVSAARADFSNWDELSWGARIVDYLWHIALPVTAMVAGSFAITAMLTKNAFLEEIRKQYVLTARAKGLSERQVLYRNVLPRPSSENSVSISSEPVKKAPMKAAGKPVTMGISALRSTCR